MSDWQPIDTAPTNTIVLVRYKNRLGKARVVRAKLVGMHTIVCDEESDYSDYCVVHDEYYWPAGWYEQMDNWDDLSDIAITEGTPDAWHPLPIAYPDEHTGEQP